MNCIEYFIFGSYMLGLIALSFLPQFLYTGKDRRDLQEAEETQTQTQTQEQETQDEQTEEQTEEQEQTEQQQQEDYTQTENMTLRRRTVIFNERDGTTTIVTEYI